MSFIRIWVHMVWGTKRREPVLNKSVRAKLFPHIKENGLEKGIYIDFVNGYVDHVHVLVSLNADQCASKIAQLIKGESSYWINKNKLAPEKFEWQDEYFAVSVSESVVDKVREYIKNQEQHHAKKTFHQEYDEFLKKYGFVMMKDSPDPRYPGLKPGASHRS